MSIDQDSWPVFVAAITFGYGATGAYGFGRPDVVDRWHNRLAHSDFVDEDFCRKYWVPFLSDGRIVPGDLPEPAPFWLRLLSAFPIKYVFLSAVGALLAIAVWVAMKGAK
ncbi:hypothetical protein MES5069_350017 [Mesorhizobium escarrei]|uniref:Uncharacterized protein n=1 Tax=Mesorhizobium escarrei TaxID=666018 RepID=A0ABN8JXH2_9HYPH|nr:hypothetical protein MES5069_350017 [Mesorhizobium escarrei]